MRGKANKAGGGIQRYLSAETSIPEEGFGSPRQGAVGKSNDLASTWPISTGGNLSVGFRVQSREQKSKGGPDILMEKEVRSGETQAGMPQIKEILADMLAKIETSLKTDIAAVRSDIVSR